MTKVYFEQGQGGMDDNERNKKRGTGDNQQDSGEDTSTY